MPSGSTALPDPGAGMLWMSQGALAWSPVVAVAQGVCVPPAVCTLYWGLSTPTPPAPDGSQSPVRAPWQEQLLAQTLFSFLLHGISNFIKELIAVPTPALPTPPYRRAAPILDCGTEHWAGQSQGIPWDQGSHSPRAATGASTMGNHPVVYRSPWAATPILLFLPSFPSH